MSIRQPAGIKEDHALGAAQAGRRRRAAALCAAAVCAAIMADGNLALAAGPISVANVAAGAASFSHVGNTTVIHASNNTIINYNQFNIPAGQAVDFVQPNSASRVLNRVIQPVPSEIDGALHANGVVYLVNPAGVIFGPNSVVNVGDLYAAAGHLSNANFLAGVDHFTDIAGSVDNFGSIRAGAVSLLGAQLINDGTISAAHGTIVLASAKDVYLTRVGGLITAKIPVAPAAQSPSAGARDTQTLASSDQLVCAGSALALAIVNSGTLRASNINIQVAGKSSSAIISGVVDASTPTRGGAVRIDAGNIAIGYKPTVGGALQSAKAAVMANGVSGGGSILIGAVPDAGASTGYADAAQRDLISGLAVISASATGSGSGGLIDTSGQQLSIASGAAISAAGAGGGAGGRWQLDPASLTIVTGAASSTGVIFTPNSTTPSSISVPGTGSYNVSVDPIDTSLGGGTSVTISSSGSLTVGTSISPDITTTNLESLTLNAGTSLSVANSITPTGNSSSLSVFLNSTAGPISITSSLGSVLQPLQAVRINSGTNAISLGANVYTDGGGQTYSSPISLTGNSTLEDVFNGSLVFTSTINGDQALDIETLGTTQLDGLVGGTAALQSLTVDSAFVSSGGTLNFRAIGSASTPSVTTLGGGQTYDASQIILNANTYLDETGAGAINFGSGATVYNPSATPVSLGVTSSSGYIAENASIGTFNLNLGPIDVALTAGGAGSGGDAIIFGAPINTDGGTFAATSTGSNPITVTGGAGGNGSTTNGAAGAATIQTGGGNATFTLAGASLNLTGGAGGDGGTAAGGAGGYALNTETGSLSIVLTASNTASVNFTGGAGGAHGAGGAAQNLGAGGTGGSAAFVGGGVSIGTASDLASSVTIQGGSGGAGASGAFGGGGGGGAGLISAQATTVDSAGAANIFGGGGGTGGAASSGAYLAGGGGGGGAGLITDAGAITINYGAASSITGGAAGAAVNGGGGGGGDAIDTIGSPLALNPAGNDLMEFNNFGKGGAGGVETPFLNGLTLSVVLGGGGGGGDGGGGGGDLTLRGFAGAGGLGGIVGSNLAAGTFFGSGGGGSTGSLTTGAAGGGGGGGWANALNDSIGAIGGIASGFGGFGGNGGTSLASGGVGASGSTFITPGSFNVGAGGTMQLFDNFTTGAGQNIQSELLLENNVTLTDASSTGIAVALVTSPTAGNNISILETGAGSVALNGNLGSSTDRLGQVVISDSTGGVSIVGTSSYTSGGISITGAATLTGSAVAINDDSPSGIAFNNSITGASTALGITETGSGSVNFGGNLSTQSLSVTGNTILGAGAATFSTSQGIAFGNITLGAATNLTDSGTSGSGITLGAVSGQAKSLTITESGTAASITLNGNISGVNNLKTQGSAILGSGVVSVSTVGGQNYATSLQIDGSTSLNDASAAGISIAELVNSANANLTIDEAGTGNVSLPTSTSTSTTLKSLTVTGSTIFTGAGSTSATAGAIITTAGQTYNSLINLSGQFVTLQDSGASGISISTVTGNAASSLTLDETGSGPISLNGIIGAIQLIGFVPVPSQPTLGSLSVEDASGAINIFTPIINTGIVNMSSGSASGPFVHSLNSGVAAIFAPVQSYTANGTNAALNFQSQDIELRGTSYVTPATSIALKQSASISDADLPNFLSSALSLTSLHGNIVLNGGSDVPTGTALTAAADGGYLTLGARSAVSLDSLNASAETAINLDNSISTSAGQTYYLAGNTTGTIFVPSSVGITLSDSSSVGVTLNGAVTTTASLPGSLTINETGSGQVAVNQAVGTSADPLANFAASSSTGGVALNGANVYTNNSQSYTGPLAVGANLLLDSGSSTAGTVTFHSPVTTGANNLSVVAGTINFDSTGVTGSGAQNYTGTSQINMATNLNAGSVLFDGTISSANALNLSVDTTGNATFEGGSPQLISGGLGTLSVTSAGIIRVAGNISAHTLSLTGSSANATSPTTDAITVGGLSSFFVAADQQSYVTTNADGSVDLQGTANFTGYPATLLGGFFFGLSSNALPTSFSVSQASPIADANLPKLGQFVTDVFGIVTPASNLNQMPYNITYTGATTAASPAISVSGQNDVAGSDLSLQAAGSEISLGSSGSSLTLGSLSINGIVNLAGTIITNGTSTNSQSYTGTLILNGGLVTLQNTGHGSVSIFADITPGTSSQLEVIDSGGGIINFLNAVGTTLNPLGSLTVDATNGSSLNIAGGSITTDGGQTYTGLVTLGGNTTLIDTGLSGAGINIAGPLTGTAFSLAVDETGSGIPVSLGSPNQTIAVRTLSVSTDPGTINLNGGNIATTNTQIINGHTVAGQYYAGTLNVLAPTTLSDSSGAPFSFAGIEGPSVLTIQAPSDAVDLTTPINPGGINITGSAISIPSGNAITTSLGQVLNGPINLNGNTTLSDAGLAGSTGIQLLSAISAPGDTLTLNQGGGVSAVIGNGPATQFNLGGLNISQGNILTRLATLVLNNPINNAGDLTLLDSLLYTNNGGTLTLAGKIDMEGNSILTAEPAGGAFSADVVSNAAIGSINDVGGVTIEGDNVTINGSIHAVGQVLLQDNNALMIGPFGLANGDFRPTSLLLINNNISGGSVLLNPDSPVVPGLGVAVPDAATIVSPGGQSVSIAGGTVAMGRDQKWTSLGNLTISGSTVSLGDLNVLGNLVVNAPTIDMLTRSFGSLLIPGGLHANSITKPDGVDVVAGNILFSSSPIALPTAAPGGPPFPQFATPSGGGIVPGYTIHIFGAATGGLTAADLYSTVLSPGITATQKYYLDLQASGPVSTNVFDTFTTISTPQIPQVRALVTLSSSQRQVLRAAGINARNPSLNELLALSDGQAVFNDIPASDGLLIERPSLIDYYVTTSRLPYHRTLAFIASYKAIFLSPVLDSKTHQPVRDKSGRIEYHSLRNKIHDQLRLAWNRYHQRFTTSKKGHATAAGFRKYLLTNPAEKTAATDLRNLSRLIYQAHELGLSQKELRLSTSTILAELSPEALSSRQFERVVLGPKVMLVTK